MRNVEIEVRMPGPPLPIVLRELVDRTCADAWQRLSTEGGSRFYYIVGEEAVAKVSQTDSAHERNRATARLACLNPGELSQTLCRPACVEST